MNNFESKSEKMEEVEERAEKGIVGFMREVFDVLAQFIVGLF